MGEGNDGSSFPCSGRRSAGVTEMTAESTHLQLYIFQAGARYGHQSLGVPVAPSSSGRGAGRDSFSVSSHCRFGVTTACFGSCPQVTFGILDKMKKFWGGRYSDRKGKPRTIMHPFFKDKSSSGHNEEDPYEEVMIPMLGGSGGGRYTRKKDDLPVFTESLPVCNSPKCTYRRASPVDEGVCLYTFDYANFSGGGAKAHVGGGGGDRQSPPSVAEGDGTAATSKDPTRDGGESAERTSVSTADGHASTGPSACGGDTTPSDSHQQPPALPKKNNQPSSSAARVAAGVVFDQKTDGSTSSSTENVVVAMEKPPQVPEGQAVALSSLTSRSVCSFMRHRPLPTPPTAAKCFFTPPPLPVKKKHVLGKNANNTKSDETHAKNTGNDTSNNTNTANATQTKKDKNEKGGAGGATGRWQKKKKFSFSSSSSDSSVVSAGGPTAAATDENRPMTRELLEFLGENLDTCSMFRNTYHKREYLLPNSGNASLVIMDLRCDHDFFNRVLVSAFHLKDVMIEDEQGGGVIFLGQIRSSDFFNKAIVFVLYGSGCVYLHREGAFFKVGNGIGDLAVRGLMDVVAFATPSCLTNEEVGTLLEDENIRIGVRAWVLQGERLLMQSARAACKQKMRSGPSCCASDELDRGLKKRERETRMYTGEESRMRFFCGPFVSQAGADGDDEDAETGNKVVPQYLTGYISYVIRDLKRRSQSESMWNEMHHVGEEAEEMFQHVRKWLLGEVQRHLPTLDLKLLKRQLDSVNGDCHCTMQGSNAYNHMKHVVSTIPYVVYCTCYHHGNNTLSYSAYLAVRSLLVLERLVFACLSWSRLRLKKPVASSKGGKHHNKKTHHNPSTASSLYLKPDLPAPSVPVTGYYSHRVKPKSRSTDNLTTTTPCEFQLGSRLAELSLTDVVSQDVRGTWPYFLKFPKNFN
ncbi:protein U14.5 [Proboscivirus elephantidbeta4]|uniref:Protein U14.5 n=1 Tax=Elephant endotheliotropic herpesvirus 4 TaxID=548914 RepID=A0A0S1TPI9_9BETA|nr:protein U14.5 [Elephant endotheliotropic herpesvirus 4]ALM25967.1 protein U14.5 [Elephant endotheliotropic herpesvirus 4]